MPLLGQGMFRAVHSVTESPTQDSQIFLLQMQVPKLGMAQQFGRLVVGWHEPIEPL